MNTGVGFCKTRVNDWARICIVARPSFDSRYAAGISIAARQSAPTTHVVWRGLCAGLWSRLSSTSGQNAAVRQSRALVLASRSNAMVLRILGQPLTLSVGAHDSHGCSHGSNAFCRPRHVVFRRAGPTKQTCVRGQSLLKGGKQNLRRSYIRDISRRPWRPVDKLCVGFRGRAEGMRSHSLLCPIYHRTRPGDPS